MRAIPRNELFRSWYSLEKVESRSALASRAWVEGCRGQLRAEVLAGLASEDSMGEEVDDDGQAEPALAARTHVFTLETAVLRQWVGRGGRELAATRLRSRPLWSGSSPRT